MRRTELYPAEERSQIINEYLESGLTIYTYCKRPDVNIAASTLYRWMKKHTRTEQQHSPVREEAPELAELGMVCYRIAEPRQGEQRLPLEQMVLFHKQVYECCCAL